MWNGKKKLIKRREVLIALLLIAVSVCVGIFFKFSKRSRYPQADLSKLPSFAESVDELAETIIPETDTPGAKSSGVGATVLLLVEHCLGEEEQYVFLRGLMELDEYCMGKFGNVFARCDSVAKLQTLNHFESSAMFGGWFITKVRQRLFGKPFIVLVKDICVTAYCRSMEGATQALAYDPVPARYDACTQMAKGQCSWALV
ncbi:gluconate 2-dehydrogenase subunit 3 family protein [Parapedobacter soli]|uniref:gluconate 2-dehydrogenase subunit 3 family protein n=1 Tax=Parapedobacter soli TaxID=416955 RepID=UPI0021C64196|nr:gluconate 2-dehydrogenase subunit 3 family protein [Parapedobacter soli]